MFVDNAGRDLILGVMPLVREMALAGTMIVLAANELPSINDITVDETGTEAGAATAGTITLKTPPDAHFTANRPFLFLLHHRPTRTPLFLGHLIDPAE